MRCKFQNTHSCVGEIYQQVLSWLFNEKLMLPSYQHYLDRFMMKQRETAMPYLQNGFFGSRHNLSPYIPLQQLAMFAPWRSQKSLPQTLGSDYWQLIHCGVEIKTWMFLYFLRSKEFFENNYNAKIGFVVFQI